jgi:uncharacterized membrane protein
MQSSEAREQLEAVDRIVAATDRTVRLPPLLLIAVGIVCAIINGVRQARGLGMEVPADQYLQLPLIALIVLIGFFESHRAQWARRESLIAGYAGAALFCAFIVTMTLSLTAQHRLISDTGMSVVWSACFSMALLFAGMMGSRLLLAAGAAMLACTALAAYADSWLPGTLAIGWLIGFLVPGLVLARGASDGRSPAL